MIVEPDDEPIIHTKYLGQFQNFFIYHQIDLGTYLGLWAFLQCVCVKMIQPMISLLTGP